jgi:hypothetical protein
LEYSAGNRIVVTTHEVVKMKKMGILEKIIALSWEILWKTRLKSYFPIQMERSTQASYLLMNM